MGSTIETMRLTPTIIESAGRCSRNIRIQRIQGMFLKLAGCRIFVRTLGPRGHVEETRDDKMI